MEENEEAMLQRLAAKFGPDFTAAIGKVRQDHTSDCEKSCEMFYCAKPGVSVPSMEELLNKDTSVASYSMGAVPPEDFASDFG